MAHAWDNLVLGGIDKPRLLLCSDNWLSNQFFNGTNLDGWTKYGTNGTLAIVSDDEAYGSNVLHYYQETSGEPAPDAEPPIDSTLNDYILRSFDVLTLTGATNFGKKFLLSLRIKTTEDTEIIITDNGSYSLSTTVINTENKFIDMFIATGEISVATSVIQVKIRTLNQPDGVNIKIDNVFFSIINNDFVFKQPNQSKLVFEENIIGSNELWSGKVQKFDRKWKPIFLALWEYLGAGWENYRQLAYQSPNIYCIPHRDVKWGFLGAMVGDFERQYSFDRFFGHKSAVEIAGLQYICELPSVKSGAGDSLFDDEIILN